MGKPMKLWRTDTVRSYYVNDGTVPYKVVHRFIDDTRPENERGWYYNYHRETWAVFGSYGPHTYARELDPEKNAYKRVLAAVQELLADAQPPEDFAADDSEAYPGQQAWKREGLE